MDTAALEELNPYKFFDTACLYVGRVGVGSDSAMNFAEFADGLARRF
jgi:hypothetical protein